MRVPETSGSRNKRSLSESTYLFSRGYYADGEQIHSTEFPPIHGFKNREADYLWAHLFD